MDNKLINAVIQLASREEKTGKFGPMAKIKDEKGLTYTVYKTKKDGAVSVAWEQLRALSVGDVVQVGFAEEVVQHPEHGTYTARTIRNFDRDIGNGMANTQAQAKSSNGGANTASQAHPDAFGRRLGVQGHINALVSNPDYYNLGTSITIEHLVKEAIAIEDEAEKQLKPSPLREAVSKYAPSVVEEDLPTIQQGDDLSPF